MTFSMRCDLGVRWAADQLDRVEGEWIGELSWSDARSAAGQSVRVEPVESREDWDAIVQRLGGSLLQGWRWGEFKREHGWTPVRLVLRRDECPRVAAQVLFRSARPFSLGYAPRGPVAGEHSVADSAVFTVALDRLSRRRRAVLSLIEPERPLALPARGSLGWGASDVLLQPRRTIKVELAHDDDGLLARMKPKTRYNVRLAERRGVVVRRGGLQDLPAFYRLLVETGARNEFGIHGVRYYADVLRVYGDDGCLLVAEH